MDLNSLLRVAQPAATQFIYLPTHLPYLRLLKGQSSGPLQLNPFVSNAPFLQPLETPENRKGKGALGTNVLRKCSSLRFKARMTDIKLRKLRLRRISDFISCLFNDGTACLYMLQRRAFLQNTSGDCFCMQKPALATFAQHCFKLREAVQRILLGYIFLSSTVNLQHQLRNI